MDPVVTAAITMLQQGDQEGARVQLLEFWARADADVIERCTIAHFLADTEAEVASELAWDLRALEAATGGSAGEDRDPFTPDLASFLPSLHLNVGDACRRAGDLLLAERHARYGIARSEALAGDGYGATVRRALDRLLDRASAGRAD